MARLMDGRDLRTVRKLYDRLRQVTDLDNRIAVLKSGNPAKYQNRESFAGDGGILSAVVTLQNRCLEVFGAPVE